MNWREIYEQSITDDLYPSVGPECDVSLARRGDLVINFLILTAKRQTTKVVMMKMSSKLLEDFA